MKLLVVALVSLTLSCLAIAQVKSPSGSKEVLPSFWESRQVVVVTVDDWSSIRGSARLFERGSRKSDWKPVGSKFDVVVGRNGLEWSADFKLPKAPPARKREGDGKAPAGIFPLTFAFGAAEKPNLVKLSFKRLDEFTECVDDPKSVHYNKIVDRMNVGMIDWGSSEKMIQMRPAYDLGVFVGYNIYPVIRGNGSCIFLHIWKDANSGTAGCTAMERADLETIVGFLEPTKFPYLVQMTTEEYEKYRTKWNLPILK